MQEGKVITRRQFRVLRHVLAVNRHIYELWRSANMHVCMPPVAWQIPMRLYPDGVGMAYFRPERLILANMTGQRAADFCPKCDEAIARFSADEWGRM